MTRRQLRRAARRKEWHPEMLNGHAEPIRALRPYIMEAVARGLVVTSTSDGVHAPGSFHKSKPKPRAVDIGVVARLVGRAVALLRLLAFQRHLHKTHGRHLSELFGPSNRANRKWGKAVTLPEGSPLETLHDNHVHVAI